MKNWRMTFCAVLGALAFGTATAEAAWPDYTIKLIVGYPPGGGTDILARVLAQQLTASIGQSVVVENKPGAGGIIGASTVAQATPDGYTIILLTSNHTVPDAATKLPYDPLKSFTPISTIAYLPGLLVVSPKLPVKTLADFIAMAKAQPGVLNFGSPGPGSAQYMDMLLFMKSAGVTMVSVPYSGAAPTLVAILRNDIQVTSSPITGFLPAVKSGQLKALAVSGTKRSPMLPDVPTYPESGGPSGFTGSENWYGIAGPAGLKPEVVKILHDRLVQAIATPLVQTTLAQQGFITIADTPEEFAKTIGDDMARWSALEKSTRAN
jgi:tripartite-type tricarboxylate transporter receptor subunit TctC